MKIKKQRGFTLLEIIIVAALILGLIFMVYPAYQQRLIKTRRADAWISLAQDQLLLEQCHARDESYQRECPLLPAFPHISRQGFYHIILVEVTPSHYQLNAFPIGSQTADQQCTLLSINQVNVKKMYDHLGHVQERC